MCFVISQASSRFSPSMNEGIRAFASARVFSKMSSKLEVLCSPVKGFTHTRCSRLSKALSVNLRGLWQNAFVLPLHKDGVLLRGGNRSQTVFDGSCGRLKKTDLQEIGVRKCPKE